MLFRTYRPAAPLGEFVDIFWYADGNAPPSHAKERVLPTGTMELVFNLREDEIRVYEGEDASRVHRSRGAILCGPQSRFFVIDTAEQQTVLGVHFRPGGAFPFLAPPAGELCGAQLALDDLWGTAAVSLRDRLLEAPGAEAKFRVLEQALLARLAHPLERHPVVAFALRELSRLPEEAPALAAVAAKSGYSRKRFIDLFEREVGLTPKLFARIGRFQQVLRLLHPISRVDWSEVALSCGYYDQAHFIRDFRAFSGLNPTRYLASRGEHLNHVPLG